VTQLGRYQIQEELGRGAMGVVYKALDPAIGRIVAIKTIRLTDLTDADERQQMRERLLREAQSAGVLSHRNIVTIYDVLEQEEFAYIFMEYVSGESLEKLLSSGSLPGSSALVDFLRQVAEALDYAHCKGILHRDIKPANIILPDAGGGAGRLAKIADFGVAKFVSQAMAQSGSMTGTPNYMSPEQIQGTTVDGRSDQFSLGVVAYELLTGAKPFTAGDVPGLFYTICKQDPKPVEQLNPTLSEASGKVLQRALRKDASERFASCADFAGALSIALEESPAWVAGTREHSAATDYAGASIAAPRTGPIISIPENPPYNLPTLPRRRGNEHDSESDERSRGSSIGKKLGVMLAMCLAIGATIVFIVRSNSGPSLPVQVLDTKLGPVTPPPEGMEVTNRVTNQARRAAKPDAPSITQSLHAQKRTQEPAASTDSNGGEGSDVELLTEPPGAKIVVDGRSDVACNAPCTLSFHRGRHTLSAELSGYSMARRIFNVPNDRSLYVSLSKSMGVLMVTSFPRACTVVVDGRPSGQTPATLHLAAGSHRVGVAGPALQQEETIEVQTDGFDAKRFSCQ